MSQTRGYDDGPSVGFVVFCIFLVLGLIVASIGGCMRYMPEYTVWQQGMEGQAELSKAEQNRKIKIEQAKADYEAAKLWATAEIERAKGAASANEIMAKSLGSPENYLRWRYIHMLEESNSKGKTGREVIYIPVDGLLPLTEATRLHR
jgi:hypothetical protein